MMPKAEVEKVAETAAETFSYARQKEARGAGAVDNFAELIKTQ
jgi:hypothetical protein